MRIFIISLFIIFVINAFEPLPTGVPNYAQTRFDTIQQLLHREKKQVDIHVQSGCILNPNKYRLPNSLWPSKYIVNLDVNMKEFTFKGKETINMTVHEDTNCIVLNIEDIVLSSPSVIYRGDQKTPTNVKYFTETGQVVIEFSTTFEKNSQLVLQTDFSGVIQEQSLGFFRQSYKVDDKTKWLAVTHFEPHGARFAFPCFDEPRFRAHYTFSFIVDKHFDVYFNTDPLRQEPQPGDRKKVEFTTTPDLPTYLVAYAVGEFEYIEKYEDGIRYRVITVEGKKEQGRFGLDLAPRIVKLFSEFFNQQYPLHKMDMISVPVYRGAMEHLGLITYMESYLLVSNESPLDYVQQVGEVIAHENAHMWTGNFMTIEWWNDLYLKEGFATFFSHYAIERLIPSWTPWDRFHAGARYSLWNFDATPESHALSHEVNTYPELFSRFNLISYHKGASVWRTLKSFLGHDRFRSWMRHFITRQPRYINTKRFFETLEGFVDPENMKSWSLKPGYPLVTLESVGSNRYVLKQKRYFVQPFDNNDDTVWWIPLVITDRNGNKRNLTFNQRQSLPFTLSEPWLKINSDEVGYYRVNYPSDWWKNLAESVKQNSKFLTVSDKVGLVENSFCLVKTADLAPSLALDLAAAFVHTNNTPFLVYTPLVTELRYIGDLISQKSAPLHQQFMSYAAKIIKPAVTRLGWNERTGEPFYEAKLRALAIQSAIYFSDADVVHQALQRYQTGDIPKFAKAAVYFAVIKFGPENEYDKFYQKFLNTGNEQERIVLIESLALARQPTNLQKTLDLLLSTSASQAEGFAALLSAARNNLYHTDYIWNFVKQNWAQIVDKFTQAMVERSLITGVTQRFFTEEQYKDVEEFFKTRSNAPQVKTALENIKRNNFFMNKNFDAIKQYFSV